MTSGKFDFRANGVGSQAYNRGLAARLRARTPRLADPTEATEFEPEIWKKALKDSVVRHAISKRLYAVAGREWSVAPASEDAREEQVAEIQEEGLKQIHDFDQSRALLASAIFRGASYAYAEGERRWLSLGSLRDPITGQPVRDPITGKVKRNPGRWWWVPTRLIDIDPYRFELGLPSLNPTDKKPPPPKSDERRVWGLWSIERDRWEPLEHPEWFIRHVYEPSEASLRYGQGLQEALYWDLLEKSELRLSLRKSARRAAEGSFMVGVDNLREGQTSADDDQEVNDWTDALNHAHEDGDLIYEKAAEVALLPVPIEGMRVVLDRISEINNDMTRLILFGIRATGGDTGASGARAQAETEAESQREAVYFDQSSLSAALDTGVLRLFLQLNRENLIALGLVDAQGGKFQVAGQAKANPQDMATTVQTLVAAGARLREDEVLERCGGWTVPKPSDRVIEQKAPAMPAYPFPLPMGSPGDDPTAPVDAQQPQGVDESMVARARPLDAERFDEAVQEVRDIAGRLAGIERALLAFKPTTNVNVQPARVEQAINVEASRVEAPITVLPQAAAPQPIVVQAGDTTVNVEAPKKKLEIKRDKDGRITGADVTSEE